MHESAAALLAASSLVKDFLGRIEVKPEHEVNYLREILLPHLARVIRRREARQLILTLAESRSSSLRCVFIFAKLRY
jgi:hypothetical protein